MGLKPVLAIVFWGLLSWIQVAPVVQAQEAPQIDPMADSILQQMGDYLKTADHFTLQVEAYPEQVLDNGQKLQMSSTNEVAVQRPDRLRGHRRGDEADDEFWYDGKRFTHLDRLRNTYASVNVPATIDAAMDEMAQRYGIVAPLVDIAYADPYRVLINNVTSGVYVGVSQVRHIRCHHLAFQQKDIDWQVWVDAGWQRVPRKIVITYKKAAGVPQFMAFLSKWDFAPCFPKDLFTFVIPPNAEQIEFTPVTQ